MAFQLEERHPQPNYEFDSEEVRFNRRFSPFACIATPPAIPYVQYKEITSFDRYVRGVSWPGGRAGSFLRWSHVREGVGCLWLSIVVYPLELAMGPHHM